MSLSRLLLFFISLLLPICLQGAEKLTLSGGGEDNDPFDRISKEVLTEAYRRIGIEISFKTLPPLRALKLSNTGKLDGEMHRVTDIEKTHPNLIKIPVPINKIEVIAFTIKEDITIQNTNDLKPYTIGIRHGIKFSKDITHGLKVHEVNKTDQLFRMLGLWRIDVALSTRTAGLKVIKKLDLKKVNIPAKPLVTLDLYHYLHSKHQHIIPLITDSLTTMESEGWIQHKYEQAMGEILESTESGHYD